MIINFSKIFNKKKKRKISGEINPEDIFVDSSNLARLDDNSLEGSLNRPISLLIEYLPAIILLLIFSIFTYRLYILEIRDFEIYKNKADNNRYNTNLIIANRGEIFDRNGKALAENIISSSTILKRKYLEDSGISNLLGYISYPKADNLNNYWQDNYIGKDGIEKVYQDLLSGINGKQIIEKDVKSLIESDNLIVRPFSGADVNLTIDIELQKRLFNSIKHVVNDRGFVSGAGVIMDVNTGEIYAITSYPEYDNNLMTNASSTEEKNKISKMLKDKRTPFLNRAVSGLFIPGSVVKPFMAYAALNENVISPEKNILSTGAITIKNKYGGPDSVFRDWKVHGYVDVVRALAVSSDEYFYQVGGGYLDQKGLGIAKIDDYANLFGLATSTGIDLPNESVGIIPTPEWKRINFIDGEWRLGDTYHTSIGQYGFQVTPIALIRYISSIANGGKLVTPHVFLSASSTQDFPNKKIVDKYNDSVWNIIDLNLNQRALKYVKDGMRAVVSEGGTVQQLNIEKLKVAAKSGTAELGVVKGKVNSLMTGYFPYDNPKYAFTVIIENGPVGGTSSAAQAIKPVLEYMRDNVDEYIK